MSYLWYSLSLPFTRIHTEYSAVVPVTTLVIFACAFSVLKIKVTLAALPVLSSSLVLLLLQSLYLEQTASGACIKEINQSCHACGIQVAFLRPDVKPRPYRTTYQADSISHVVIWLTVGLGEKQGLTVTICRGEVVCVRFDRIVSFLWLFLCVWGFSSASAPMELNQKGITGIK